MIAPDDDFWRVEDYERVHGPLALAKKRKHKVTKLHGIRGVLVPTTDSATPQPFKVRRRLAEEIVHEQEHDVGDSSDMDPDDADQKYRDLCEEASDAYKKSCVGMVSSILATCAMSAGDEQNSNGGLPQSSNHKNNTPVSGTPAKEAPSCRKRRPPEWT